MDEDQVRIPRLQPPTGRVAALAAAVVYDPEDARRGAVGFPLHHRVDQFAEGDDAGRRVAASDHPAALHVAGDQIRQRPAACVLVFHAHRLAGAGRGRGVTAHPRLDARLLVGADEAGVRRQRLARPPPGVPVEDAAGFLGAALIAGIAPVLVLPGLERSAGEDAPRSAASGRRCCSDCAAGHAASAARRPAPAPGRPPAGGKRAYARVPFGRSGQSRRSPSVSARCTPNWDAARGAGPPPRCRAPAADAAVVSGIRQGLVETASLW